MMYYFLVRYRHICFTADVRFKVQAENENDAKIKVLDLIEDFANHNPSFKNITDNSVILVKTSIILD